MTPERIAALVHRWARLYTRGLPAPIAQRRVDELAADVRDHVAHERAAGVPEGRIARAVGSRMLRGLAADLAWRRRQPKARLLARPSVRVALGVTAVLAVPAAASVLSDEMAWGVGDFVLAAVLLAIVGTAVDLAVRRAGSRRLAGGIGLVGVVSAVLGELDDAPGLVLVGILLAAGACALAVRRARA